MTLIGMELVSTGRNSYKSMKKNTNIPIKEKSKGVTWQVTQEQS